jgi:hypothetical protein
MTDQEQNQKIDVHVYKRHNATPRPTGWVEYPGTGFRECLYEGPGGRLYLAQILSTGEDARWTLYQREESGSFR